jgi:drug/metabolite transporter (DMT)-like permease
LQIPDQYKGFGLATGYYVLVGGGSIAIKLFMEASSVETTMLLWYFAGTVLTLALMVYHHGGFTLRPFAGKWGVYMSISLIMTFAVVGWFLSVRLAGPGIASFVQQLGIVFSVLLAAFALGERLTWTDAVGGTLAILGALSITYRSSEDVVMGTVSGGLGAVAFAAHGYLIKRHIAIIDKVDLLFVRTIVVCAIVLAVSVFSGGLVIPSVVLFATIPIAAALVHVLSNLMLYVALEYADLTKVSILMVVQPVVAMIGSYIILQSVPTSSQLAGSSLILVGISIILLQPLLMPRVSRLPAN